MDTPFDVSISLYNIGNGTAYNIQTQEQWPTELPVVKGDTNIKIDELQPGQSYTYKYSIKPTIEGM